MRPNGSTGLSHAPQGSCIQPVKINPINHKSLFQICYKSTIPQLKEKKTSLLESHVTSSLNFCMIHFYLAQGTHSGPAWLWPASSSDLKPSRVEAVWRKGTETEVEPQRAHGRPRNESAMLRYLKQDICQTVEVNRASNVSLLPCGLLPWSFQSSLKDPTSPWFCLSMIQVYAPRMCAFCVGSAGPWPLCCQAALLDVSTGSAATQSTPARGKAALESYVRKRGKLPDRVLKNQDHKCPPRHLPKAPQVPGLLSTVTKSAGPEVQQPNNILSITFSPPGLLSARAVCRRHKHIFADKHFYLT